jgi:hypothetical protein
MWKFLLQKRLSTQQWHDNTDKTLWREMIATVGLVQFSQRSSLLPKLAIISTYYTISELYFSVQIQNHNVLLITYFTNYTTPHITNHTR